MPQPKYLTRMAVAVAITVLLAGCVGQPKVTPAEQAQINAQILRESIAFLSEKRFSDALTHVKKLRPTTNTDPRVVMTFAIASDMAGQFPASTRAYKRLSESNVQSAHLLNNMGYSMMLQGKLDQALTYLREAQRLDPGNVTIRNNLKMLTSVVPTR